MANKKRDIFTDMLPQAINSIRRSILDPLFGDNLMRKYANEKSPLRSELYSFGQAQQHAFKLAKSHRLTDEDVPEQLLRRLAENESVLIEVHSLLTETVRIKKRVAPAGEWLLDNFYLIEEQIYTGKKHLPKGYSKELPKLVRGQSQGLPRVYDIAIEILSHSDARLDMNMLTAFINSYQNFTTLKLGELWAIPIMLRLALLENLRRLATQIAVDILNQNVAGHWADALTETAEKDPKNLVLVIADMARSNPPMESSFIAEFTRRLQGKGSALALPLSWIEQRLSENGLTSLDLVYRENQKQAAAQMSISNSISSLRFLNTTNWKDFVESVSVVEQILRQDQANIYIDMEFSSRDQYRHMIERISRHSDVEERKVAELVVQTAQQHRNDERRSHVGYYLTGKGICEFESIVAVRKTFRDKCKSLFNRAPLWLYSGSIFLLSILTSWYLFNRAYKGGVHNLWLLPLGIAALIATSQLSLTLINWLVTFIARPYQLPRLDFSKGIPQNCRSLVVVPTMLTSRRGIDDLVEALEVRFLANRDRHLHFALLTDFKDAESEVMPEDDLLLQHVKQKIIGLNRKYESTKDEFFFLFHRPRKWNPKEKAWMGEERKRGKLGALNALLRGTQSENFSVIIGERTLFPEVRYVITLDTDTSLPRESAWKMIATLAHPLNKAYYDETKQRVTDGYSILQPRVSNSLPESGSSIYKRIHGNDAGTDPYTNAVSDVYQDLFFEASFIGKGIYDVDAFEKTLAGRFPDNRILSHDLLEGNYARCGLISDVQLYEEYPSNYITDMQRHHRWVRGDWQIASWLFPRVPGPGRKRVKNPLNAVSKWKIFDNLRRSFVSLSMLSLILFGWLISGNAAFWTTAVLAILFIPVLLSLSGDIAKKPKDVEWWPHFSYSVRSAYNNTWQQILYFIFIPYNAWLNLHAILRTYWRLLISRRKLLEWNPSGNLQGPPKTVFAAYTRMFIEPLLGAILMIWFLDHGTWSLFIELPVLILWMASPIVEWWVGLNWPVGESQLSSKQHVFLRRLSRKTWEFFEKFVGEEDNWLPPDNYQEQPDPRIAHRTSPTNIGISLLSNLAAYDFGYITVDKLIERCSNTFDTLFKLERFNNHLYNWYDTVSLAPLHPKYISTVDSGNFASHLMVLKQGLLDLKNKPIFSVKIFDGMQDTIDVMSNLKEKKVVLEQMKKELDIIRKSHLANLKEVIDALQLLDKPYQQLHNSFSIASEKETESYKWLERLGQQINDARTELLGLAPWLLQDAPSARLQELASLLSKNVTLHQLTRIEVELMSQVKLFAGENYTKEENEWANDLSAHITHAAHRAKQRMLMLEGLARYCEDFADLSFDFLYDRRQHLFTIGYNVDEHRRDNSFYDLLASEARLTTFTAIAQGKIPQESWFALGRQLTSAGTSPILLSWSGSMFEYLMPMLVVPSYENTLLDQTHKAIVLKQIEYGRKRNVPWGISESGYNAVDSGMNYQYRAFGVPGLGFKRGLADDLVVSPYSSMMALMIAPDEACRNMEYMASAGFEGEYGFYEAIDYTQARLPRGQDHVVIKSYMCHHQGMGFLALAYSLLDRPMQKRFESEVRFQATLLLLQERIPRVSTFYSPVMHLSDTSRVAEVNNTAIRVINTPDTPVPEIQLLSNGRYHVMITNAGGGYSRWKDVSLTRWREDGTCDNWGNFCFIKDVEQDSSLFWSPAYQPSLKEGENYEAVFSQGRAEFRRRDFGLETHTEIVVSPEDDVELRRLKITNRSRKKRTIEITSYAEVVLAKFNADVAHPAFSNLFIQTEIKDKLNAIICTRRPRSDDEHNPSMFHLMKVHKAEVIAVGYETDRSKFIGRSNTIHQPDCLQNNNTLSGTSGSVLDPIISIRYRITIESQETATVDMLIGIADTKELCNALVEKYQDRYLRSRAIELSWTHSQVVLRQINATEEDAQLYSKLAGSVIFSNPALRADQNIIIKNKRGQSSLWSYSVSGDLPIVLVQIEDSANIELVKQMLQAHAYWRLKGLIVDLVIWNEDHGGYRQVLQNEIQSLIAPELSNDMKDRPGGIFFRSSDQISNEDRILFQTLARIIISDKLGSLNEQANRKLKIRTSIPYFTPTKFYPSVASPVALPQDLQFFNGIGGFSKDGKEYVIITTPGKYTPAPWINVLANENFATIVSESGQSYSWLENAHEFRLTPWNNDPVSDLSGEAFYIRDEENGKYWSPAPLPVRSKTPFITRHGFGYSIIQHMEDNIYSEMTVFVDLNLALKFVLLKFHNHSKRSRRLSVTGYMEWVLGDLKPKTQMHVITEVEVGSGAILVRNPYNTEFENRVVFFDTDEENKTHTSDRVEFIGRNGSIRNPEAMSKAKLSGRTGAALDPCTAIQVSFDIDDEEEHEVIFRIGAVREYEDIPELIKGYKGSAFAHEALEKVKHYWTQTLGVIEIQTPDNALNILTNGWLNYQSLACRIWARSGFYQSGGAFGFRDQLQDTLSLLYSKPFIVHRQILLNASRQFKEGDVQHWWHPPTGRGVRTTCSDDLLWLPFVTARYVSSTGDKGILDESIYFLEGRMLNAGEESYYDLPIRSHESASLYEHCKRSIERALKFGEHGIPFIGSGDWNDGMDKVGEHGKGESVWLAFFLYDILQRFEEIAKIKQDEEFAIRCKQEARQLKNNIENNCWDGEWYRRAYFDDGTPLGSSQNDECRIDSIVQSWSVLSGAGDKQRSKTAIGAADKYLIRKEEKLIQLFEPPFDKSQLNPGYIKGYVPGVRENGGQYTHAAIWLVMAFAALKDKDRTWELLQMINPINHGSDADSILKYKVEPYVMAADIYAEPLHLGRGGWTWYTGSAGWMYQLIIEWFLGLRRQGETIWFEPCVPASWKSFNIRYQYMDTAYVMNVVQDEKAADTKIYVDNELQPNNHITIINDAKEHQVNIMIGTGTPILEKI